MHGACKARFGVYGVLLRRHPGPMTAEVSDSCYTPMSAFFTQDSTEDYTELAEPAWRCFAVAILVK